MEPPEVISVCVLQPRQCHLRSLAGLDIGAHPGHQGFEGVEAIRCRRCSKTVVERVLTESAFRPVEGREHIIEVQIIPRPVVQRSR